MLARASTKAIVVSRWSGTVDKGLVFASVKAQLRKQSHLVKQSFPGFKVRFAKQASFGLAPDGLVTGTWPFAVE